MYMYMYVCICVSVCVRVCVRVKPDAVPNNNFYAIFRAHKFTNKSIKKYNNTKNNEYIK